MCAPKINVCARIACALVSSHTKRTNSLRSEEARIKLQLLEVLNLNV